MKKSETFGSYLRRERETRGLTREDISQATKISRSVIEALETDDYRSLPEDTYVRGYLRAFAREMNLSSEELIQRYRDFREEVEQKEQTTERQKESFRSSQAIRISPVVKILAVLVVVAIGGVFTWKIVAIRRNISFPGKINSFHLVKNTEQISSPLSVSEPVAPEFPSSISEVSKVVEEEMLSAPVKEPGLPAKRASIVFVATENVWIKFAVDFGQYQEVLLRPGEKYEIRGYKNFDLLIGNAGGVELMFNGKTFPALGPSGRVVHLKLPVADGRE